MKAKALLFLNTLVDIPVALVTSIKNLLTTGKGSLLLIISIIILLDVIFLGKLNFLNTGVAYLGKIASLLKDGYTAGIIALAIIFWKK